MNAPLMPEGGGPGVSKDWCISVFGRISRRDESDRAAIAVINRLAFLAEFRGEMAVIAQRSLFSIA